MLFKTGINPYGACRTIFVLVVLLDLAGRSHVQAQTGSTATDSLRSYELSGIVVGAGQDSLQLRQSVRRIRLADLVQQDAISAADIMRLVPSAFLQTNSRGESLVYIRSAGERQVSTFLDGAVLNIPWDNRVDLSMVPATVIGGLEVMSGAPSIRFGANAIGGAVNILSRDLARRGSLTEVQFQGGGNGTGLISGMHVARTAKTSILISGAYSTTDGMALPAEHGLEFSQLNADVRTNTDRSLANLYLRVTRDYGRTWKIGVSALHVGGRKGVAPEGHINPAEDRVRFWRYPEWQNSMVIINAEGSLAAKTGMSATAWLGRFAQRIDSYQSVNYENVMGTEDGLDMTAGARLLSTTALTYGSLDLAVHFTNSRHREIETEQAVAANPLYYSQNLYSAGAEYRHHLSGVSDFLIGASLDGSTMLETGDKPGRPNMTALGFVTAVETVLSGDQRAVADQTNGTSTRFSMRVGRKSRFPTMRELFGESLETFVVNPDLQPESAWLADVSLGRSSEDASLDVTLFARRTFDTIDRINVIIDGVQKRLRVNIDGSRVVGVELVGTARLPARFGVDAHFMWARSTALMAPGNRPLNEKPEILSTASLQYATDWGGSFRGTVQYTGGAYSLAPDNSQIQLPTSFVVNLRASLRHYISVSGLFIEMYAGVKNVSDTLTEPQAGLPGAGREWQLGLSTSF